jgi:AcrR family transcriptional regulator
VNTAAGSSPAPERRLRRDAERNRQRILTAAADAFAEVGLSVTMDEIARRAGVGVGTVYRRFPDKEQLIDALFEQRLDELVELAEAALAEEDGWTGIVRFFESFLALQAADRGLKEVVLGTGHGRDRVRVARGRIAPVVRALIERAQAQGSLRPDVMGPDIALVQFMVGAVIDYTHDVDPGVWRRLLAIVLDGLRTRREGPSELPAPPLRDDQLDSAMETWRPVGR